MRSTQHWTHTSKGTTMSDLTYPADAMRAANQATADALAEVERLRAEVDAATRVPASRWIADSWRSHCAKVEAERDDALGQAATALADLAEARALLRRAREHVAEREFAYGDGAMSRACLLLGNHRSRQGLLTADIDAHLEGGDDE